MNKELNILQFIDNLRNSDRYIETIYTEGGCYQFYLLLGSMFIGCTPLISRDKDHIVTRYDNKYYDITGEVNGTLYSEMLDTEITTAESWSFCKNRVLELTKCQFCDEPIII